MVKERERKRKRSNRREKGGGFGDFQGALEDVATVLSGGCIFGGQRRKVEEINTDQEDRHKQYFLKPSS